jgi:hypothetical protein
MRHVDLDDIEDLLPANWPQIAKAAVDALDGLDAEARKAKIKTNPTWQALQDVLGDYLDGKCWYCESIIKRSPTPVDHFRPKGNVIEAPDHGGYWWLAYNWRNYRFAYTHCNTFGTAEKRGKEGGKNDHFPLREESRRAKGPRPAPNQPDPLDYEDPILLDPACDGDPSYLWFNEDGTILPHPRLCVDKKGIAYRRADESIKIYGLYQDELNERRKVRLVGADNRGGIRKLLNDTDELLVKADAGDATAKGQFDDKIAELREAMDERAEYSSAVKCFLMACRGTSRSAEIALG